MDFEDDFEEGRDGWSEDWNDDVVDGDGIVIGGGILNDGSTFEMNFWELFSFGG